MNKHRRRDNKSRNYIKVLANGVLAYIKVNQRMCYSFSNTSTWKYLYYKDRYYYFQVTKRDKTTKIIKRPASKEVIKGKI